MGSESPMNSETLKALLVGVLAWAAWTVARSRAKITYAVGDINQTLEVSPVLGGTGFNGYGPPDPAKISIANALAGVQGSGGNSSPGRSTTPP